MSHHFRNGFLKETRYNAPHRFVGFCDLYREPAVMSQPCNDVRIIGKRNQYMYNIVHTDLGDYSTFRDSELERMRLYGMPKGDMLAETRERWLVVQNNKKRSQDAADEQSAKRSCVAPPEAAAQQDNDCVFVKASTLAERDAIGRANAIVLD
eukprot:2632092-Prymnesium_polylepis.2